MQTINIQENNYVQLYIVAQELKISQERVNQLITAQHIEKVKLNYHTVVISLVDFEKLKNTPRITGRPTRKNK